MKAKLTSRAVRAMLVLAGLATFFVTAFAGHRFP